VTRPLGLLVLLAIVCGAAAAIGSGGSEVSHAGPRAKATGPTVGSLQRKLARLERQVEQMEQSAENAEDWMTCIKYVPVNEQGDRDRQSGYLYDERDGTGVGHMDGIAVDRRRRRGREDYLFMHFRGGGCQSASPEPGGTAEPASAAGRLKALEQRAKRLSRRSQRLETISERFDEWESCVSWVPVTEMGDPDRKFGYLFGPKGSWPGYRTALHVDRSDWDDPDYQFLALVGGDRPGRRCQDEPGEAPD
jgi:hypothetical protein